MIDSIEPILNRPFINGKPVEGPEPFSHSMTLVEAVAIGALSPKVDRVDSLTTNDLKKLYEFRLDYPQDYSQEVTQYPSGVLHAAGMNILNELIDEGEQND